MALQYMTQEGLDKLKKELAEAIAQRPVISAAIAEARDKGDLSENAEYHAAKRERGKNESRIRFLRNMIRAIVGTLVDVGRGRYTVEEFEDIIRSKELSRSSAGAPAQGLFLSDVIYEEDIFTND